MNYSTLNFIKTGIRLAISTFEKITISKCYFNIQNQSFAQTGECNGHFYCIRPYKFFQLFSCLTMIWTECLVSEKPAECSTALVSHQKRNRLKGLYAQFLETFRFKDWCIRFTMPYAPLPLK